MERFRLSIAPMMDWTDRHYRFFMRGITREAWLYTEMVPTGSIIYGDRDRFLTFNDCEHPIVLQLGGSDPKHLAECSRIAEDYGYNEINLNVGCPSDRVVDGNFGASLMSKPELVADCISVMQAAVKIPVTIKCRIGISVDNRRDIEYSDYDFLQKFIKINADAGCKRFILHARIAVLGGLSPKANRQVPPLRYDVVSQVKQEFSQLKIEINGGIVDLNQAWKVAKYEQPNPLDGVMIGRAAYDNPWIFNEADQKLGSNYKSTYKEVIERLIPYLDQVWKQQDRAQVVTRHILGLFHGVPGARNWRRCLSDHKFLKQAKNARELLETAMQELEI